MVFDNAFVHVFCLLCIFHLCQSRRIIQLISLPAHYNKLMKEKEATPPYVGERSKSVSCLKNQQNSLAEREEPPPIPPLPLNYQRSDGEFIQTLLLIQRLYLMKFTDEGSYQTNENKNELKKLRAMSKASKQAELKR